MSNAPALALSPTSLVGEIVAARPALARVFEELQIDYCCGGKQTVAAAATRRGLPVPDVCARLQAAAEALVAGPAEVDAAAMTLVELADHIEHTHHAYLKAELPRLVEMADRVATKHGWRDQRLPEVAEETRGLAEEMICHMQKEEFVLFPLVREIETRGPGEFSAGLAGPIRQMEVEHEDAGAAIARLRELTGGFQPDENCCNTHRALLDGLARFESDLFRHVHKENNVLFPRALQRAGA